MTWLGALRQLNFNHFYVGMCSLFLKFFRIEITVFIATAKIACTNLPHYISAVLQMIWANAPLPGIMIKTA